MAGFLRKKSNVNAKVQQQQQAQELQQSRPVQPAQAPSQSLPPLYARFASSNKSSVGLESPASTSQAAKVVSGPMALGSNFRRDGGGIVGNNVGRPARNDVKETQNPPPPIPRAKGAELPPKPPAVRESWYRPAPSQEAPATPPSHSPHSHHHSNHNHHRHHQHRGSRTSPEPPYDHSRHEKPLPKPVPTPPSSRPPSRQARANNVAISHITSPITATQDSPHSLQSQKLASHRQMLTSSGSIDHPRNETPRESGGGSYGGARNEAIHTPVKRTRDETALAMSRRTSTMVPSPGQVRHGLPQNAVQTVKAPVATVSTSPNVPLSHRTSMQAELVPSRAQEYNNKPPPVAHTSPTSPTTSNRALPPPPSSPMAISKIKSAFRSDRKSSQPPPVVRSVPEQEVRLRSPSVRPEALPRSTTPAMLPPKSPASTSSPSLSHEYIHSPPGTFGMMYQDGHRVETPPPHTYQPQHQNRSSPHIQMVSPPLSPKLDHLPPSPPMLGKPLIFAAMHTIDDARSRQSVFANPPAVGPSKMGHAEAGSAYPSPPMEFSPASLDRTRPLPSQNLYTALQSNVASDDVPPPPVLQASTTPPPTPPKPSVTPPRKLASSLRDPSTTQSPRPPSYPSDRQGSPVKVSESPSSRSGSPLNHHIRKLSKSAISVRSLVTSQISVNSSSTHLSSSNGHQQPGASRSRSGTPVVNPRLLPPTDGSEEGNAENSLLDDDPFARIEGVKMLKPVLNEGGKTHRRTLSKPDSVSSGHGREKRARASSKPPSPEPVANQAGSQQSYEEGRSGSSPITPEKYRDARSKRRGEGLEKMAPPVLAEVPLRKDRPANPFPLELLLVEPSFLAGLLTYLTFAQWSGLTTLNKHIRALLLDAPELREVTLEQYLSMVGYERWTYESPDPLPLSIKDLNDYMRGVSIPTHEYPRVATLYAQARVNRGMPGYESILEQARSLAACTRSYTRVVLRLRAQAEADSRLQASRQQRFPPPAIYNHSAFGARSQVSISSRAPSPSSMSHGHASVANSSVLGQSVASVSGSSGFRSPLYRARRAPLLRVFIPSQDEWLSDEEVVACEDELKRAGVMEFMRLGDVVWDIAVGDEGNVGRLVWDGNFLLDLDYTYSSTGDLPKYIHSLALSPSYFHRVIRTGTTSSNPIVHIDIRPWGEEIAANLQLLQDRVRTETPQGAYHNVVRWVHRSSFVIRPAGRAPSRPSSRAGSRSHSAHAPSIQPSARIPIPDTDGLFIDSGWFGTVVVETEGTNEALADLQDRCGPGAFPPRIKNPHERATPAVKDQEGKKVFRVLRERSRPGELWIQAVSHKERLL